MERRGRHASISHGLLGRSGTNRIAPDLVHARFGLLGQSSFLHGLPTESTRLAGICPFDGAQKAHPLGGDLVVIAVVVLAGLARDLCLVGDATV